MEPLEFDYKIITKKANAIYVTSYLVFGIGLSIYGLHIGAPGLATGLKIIWAILGLLILFSLLAALRERKLYAPVMLNENGITAFRILPTRFPKPSKEAYLVNWSKIDQIESFSFPDHDALLGRGKSGLRIKIGNEKIVIWENIDSFSKVKELINQHVHQTSR